MDCQKQISTSEYRKSIILHQYDLNGDIKNTPILLPFDDFQFYKVDSSILIGKQKIGINTYKFVGYDFENGFQSITIDAFEYDNDNISFLSRKNEMLNFLFKSAMTDFIGVNDIQIVYMNTFYHPEIYIIDIFNNMETTIELYNYISNGYYVFECLNGDTISIAVTNTSGFSLIELMYMGIHLP